MSANVRPVKKSTYTLLTNGGTCMVSLLRRISIKMPTSYNCRESHKVSNIDYEKPDQSTYNLMIKRGGDTISSLFERKVAKMHTG